ncbi:unnamed protein product, partial [Closterium sp. Naga37s-1]
AAVAVAREGGAAEAGPGGARAQLLERLEAFREERRLGRVLQAMRERVTAARELNAVLSSLVTSTLPTIRSSETTAVSYSGPWPEDSGYLPQCSIVSWQLLIGPLGFPNATCRNQIGGKAEEGDLASGKGGEKRGKERRGEGRSEREGEKERSDRKGDERKGDERKGDERKGDERKGDERKGDERKGDEKKGEKGSGEEGSSRGRGEGTGGGKGRDVAVGSKQGIGGLFVGGLAREGGLVVGGLGGGEGGLEGEGGFSAGLLLSRALVVAQRRLGGLAGVQPNLPSSTAQVTLSPSASSPSSHASSHASLLLDGLFSLESEAIAGLNNFNADSVAAVVSAAEKGGATVVDIACDADLVRLARSLASLPICVSAVEPEKFVEAVAAGAHMIEIGNFDSFYPDGREFTAEEVLDLTRRTRQLLPSIALSVTVPHTLPLPEQVALAEALQECGADVIQTEGGTSSAASSAGVQGLVEKATPTIAATYSIARAVTIPVMCASGLSAVTVPLAFAAGASGVGVGSAINRLNEPIAMVAAVCEIADAVNSQVTGKKAAVSGANN